MSDEPEWKPIDLSEKPLPKSIRVEVPAPFDRLAPGMKYVIADDGSARPVENFEGAGSGRQIIVGERTGDRR
ncbi:hypothetical protein [Methyloceanibacter caenitepidi]|nr:hypothetical protein [Methyloceanibacter caenitepidi]